RTLTEQLIRQKRRSHGPRQDSDAGAALGSLNGQSLLACRKSIAESARLAKVRHDLRAVRIIKSENRRLSENIGGAEAGWMLWISLDLSRPALVTFDEKSCGVTAQRHGRREIECSAGDESVWLADIRQNLFRRRRLCRTTAHSCQRQGRTHQHQEL